MPTNPVHRHVFHLSASPERDRSWHAPGRPKVTFFPSPSHPTSLPIQTAAELIRQTLRKGEERTELAGKVMRAVASRTNDPEERLPIINTGS